MLYMTHSSELFVARVNFDHQLFGIGYQFKIFTGVGAKWLLVKKVNFTPWLIFFYIHLIHVPPLTRCTCS